VTPSRHDEEEAKKRRAQEAERREREAQKQREEEDHKRAAEEHERRQQQDAARREAEAKAKKPDTIRVTCSKCNHTQEYPPSFAGLTFQCKGRDCHHRIEVPRQTPAG
jgi:hypothetical protein